MLKLALKAKQNSLDLHKVLCYVTILKNSVNKPYFLSANKVKNSNIYQLYLKQNCTNKNKDSTCICKKNQDTLTTLMSYNFRSLYIYSHGLNNDNLKHNLH